MPYALVWCADIREGFRMLSIFVSGSYGWVTCSETGVTAIMHLANLLLRISEMCDS